MSIPIAVDLVFVLLCDLVPQGTYFLLHGEAPGATVPGWFLGLQALSPVGAYSVLVTGVLAAADAGLPGLAARIDGSFPVYLEGWFLLALLVVWTVDPLALGYRRFRRADLYCRYLSWVIQKTSDHLPRGVVDSTRHQSQFGP